MICTSPHDFCARTVPNNKNPKKHCFHTKGTQNRGHLEMLPIAQKKCAKLKLTCFVLSGRPQSARETGTSRMFQPKQNGLCDKAAVHRTFAWFAFLQSRSKDTMPKKRDFVAPSSDLTQGLNNFDVLGPCGKWTRKCVQSHRGLLMHGQFKC